MTFIYFYSVIPYSFTLFYFFVLSKDLIAPPELSCLLFLISSVYLLINMCNWGILNSGLAYLF